MPIDAEQSLTRDRRRDHAACRALQLIGHWLRRDGTGMGFKRGEQGRPSKRLATEASSPADATGCRWVHATRPILLFFEHLHTFRFSI